MLLQTSVIRGRFDMARQIKLEILCEWRPIIFDGFAFIFALVGDLIRIFPEA